MRVLVIGAGVSGLAAAWYLADAGADVRVVEAADRPGGLIRTRHVPEGLIESAARAFTWTPRVSALFEAAGIPPQFAREESKRRYIFRDGRARRWPLTPVETAEAAARFGRAWIGRQTRPKEAETVATWGSRVLGPAAVTWLLGPALQGIYASPPEALSAAALFGRSRPRGGRLAAPTGGMSELFDRLHDRLRSRGVAFEFNTPLRAIDVQDRIVICTNARAAANLLSTIAPTLAARLRKIQMVSLVTVTAFFEPHDADLRGFGVLFPRSSGIAALGVLFNTEIFDGRSALRSETWIYGNLSASSLPKNDVEAVGQIAADRAILTGRRHPPIAIYATPQIEALPVYDAAVIDAAAALPSLPSGVAIAGNYLGRLGISSLLDGAAAAVDRIMQREAAA
jgi:oxygen-dependent protoporphyrinogen oxidase